MIKNLQSLRFIFILLVFMSHITWASISFDFGGECGVSFFFILSGFVLSVGYGTRIENGEFRNRQFAHHYDDYCAADGHAPWKIYRTIPAASKHPSAAKLVSGRQVLLCRKRLIMVSFGHDVLLSYVPSAL